MEIVNGMKERRGEKAAFLGGVFSAHVGFAKKILGRRIFTQAVTRKNLLCHDVAPLLRIQ